MVKKAAKRAKKAVERARKAAGSAKFIWSRLSRKVFGIRPTDAQETK